MHKYSNLNDFDLDKLIASIIFKNSIYTLKFDEHGYIYLMKGKKVLSEAISYVNNSSAIFDLLVKNKMSLIPIVGTKKWIVIGDFIMNNDGSGEQISAVHTNPCRAIAECFLLMKGVGG